MSTIDQLWRELYELGGKERIRQLLEIDPSQAKAMRYGVSLLHIAAGSEYSDEVLLLLSHGADVNAIDKYGDTPLHRAASGSMPGICRILLQHGASTTIRNQHGKLPLDCAKQGDIWAWREDCEETIRLVAEASGHK